MRGKIDNFDNFLRSGSGNDGENGWINTNNNVNNGENNNNNNDNNNNNNNNNNCWKGTLDASKYPNICVQTRDFKTIIGSEDCLYLNIVAPLEVEENGAKLPVFVFIHGGDNTMGAAEDYDMSKLAMEGAIVVSIQYRLAGFGYLALSELSADQGGVSGNYGIMDCISALRFVRKNIAAFGGNPELVTLVGQSSGGTNILALMIAPMARGLFHRTINLSGSYKIDEPLASAEATNRIFLERSNCLSPPPPHTVLSCIYALSTVQVMQASPLNVFPFWDSFGDPESNMIDIPKKGHLPANLVIVDGRVIPESSWTAFSTHNRKIGKVADVPSIMSIMRNEMDIAPAVTPTTQQELTSDLEATLGTFGPEFASRVEAEYNVNDVADKTDVYEVMARDIRFFCPCLEVARQAAAALTSPVFVVLNDLALSHPFDIIGWLDHVENGFATSRAAHMIDLILAVEPAEAKFSDSDRQHAKMIRSLWVDFAIHGTSSGLYPFNAFGTGNKGEFITQITDEGEIKRTVNPSAGGCAAWEPIMREYACNN